MGICAGRIPEELEGTLLRNGPGLFDIGSTAVNQPFDGDGMVQLLLPCPMHWQEKPGCCHANACM
jgi:hypothetical protein